MTIADHAAENVKLWLQIYELERQRNMLAIRCAEQANFIAKLLKPAPPIAPVAAVAGAGLMRAISRHQAQGVR